MLQAPVASSAEEMNEKLTWPSVSSTVHTQSNFLISLCICRPLSSPVLWFWTDSSPSNFGKGQAYSAVQSRIAYFECYSPYQCTSTAILKYLRILSIAWPLSSPVLWFWTYPKQAKTGEGQIHSAVPIGIARFESGSIRWFFICEFLQMAEYTSTFILQLCCGFELKEMNMAEKYLCQKHWMGRHFTIGFAPVFKIASEWTKKSTLTSMTRMLHLPCKWTQ